MVTGTKVSKTKWWCGSDTEVEEKEETGMARRTVTSLKSFAACLRDQEPRHLGRITEAERRLLKQSRSVELRATKLLGWRGGQKRERETGEGVSLPTVQTPDRLTKSPYAKRIPQPARPTEQKSTGSAPQSQI